MADFFQELSKKTGTQFVSADEQHNQTVPSVYRGVAPKGDNIFTKAAKSVGNFGLGIAKDAGSAILTPFDRAASAVSYGAAKLTGNEDLANAVLDRANSNHTVAGIPVAGAAQTIGGGVEQSLGDTLKAASYLTTPASLGKGTGIINTVVKNAKAGAIGGATYGAGEAMSDTNTQDLGNVISKTVTGGISGGIGGGIFGTGTGIMTNLLSKRAEKQAALKLLNSKSLVTKDSEAIASHLDDMLSPNAVNDFAKNRFGFETPEFLRDKSGAIDKGVFEELKDEVSKQISTDLPFKNAVSDFEKAIKNKPMTESTLRDAYMDVVNSNKVLDPKSVLYKIEGGKLVNDKVAKELVSNNIPVSDIQVAKSLSGSEKSIFNDMVNVAESKLNNPLTEDRITKPIAENLINTYDNYVVKNGAKIGKQLGDMRGKMSGVKISTEPVVSAYDELLKNLDIAKNNKTGELLFANSRVRSSPKIMDAIMKVDSEINTLGAAKTAKNADIITENLRQIVQDEPSVQGTYAQKLIGGIKSKIDDVIDASMPGYKQAKTDFAKNKAIQDEMESVFGNNFDPTDVNRGAELVRRLEGNTSARLQNLVDAVQSEAEKSGYTGVNLKGLTRLAATLERVTGSTPVNSLEGIGNSVLNTGIEAVKGNIVGAAKGVADMATRKTKLEPQDYIRLYRELIK